MTCHAIFNHGAGHQLVARCELTGEHDLHSADVSGLGLCLWKGMSAETLPFDDPAALGPPEYRFAFYGTLMGDDGRGRSLRGLGRSLGPCVLQGDLHSVGGAYPALVPGDGLVVGELWEVRPEHLASAKAVLDGIEGYQPNNLASSLYVRELVEVVEPEGVQAWTYIWNGSIGHHPRIVSGDWAAEDERRWSAYMNGLTA